MRRSHKYCDHNKVRQSYADGGKVEMKKPKKGSPPPKKIETENPPGGPKTPGAKKPDPKMLGTGAAAKAGDILKNKRKQQMKDLGL